MPQSREIEGGEVETEWVDEHSHRTRERENGIRGFLEGRKLGKEITFEMYIKIFH